MSDFFLCEHCKNLTYSINNSGVKMICCGEPMSLLKDNIVDAALEKHVPSVTIENNILNVQIGNTLHPMLENHYIQFIFLETNVGIQIKKLSPNEKPTATFLLKKDEKPLKVYEYCNIHGLWSKEL